MTTVKNAGSVQLVPATYQFDLSDGGINHVRGTVEVTAQGVDKGTALLALADMLGIPREATAAIGDSENDHAMLARAGVAAVMANALPEIRALGDIVSTRDNDHDGVAELFERLGL